MREREREGGRRKRMRERERERGREVGERWVRRGATILNPTAGYGLSGAPEQGWAWPG